MRLHLPLPKNRRGWIAIGLITTAFGLFANGALAADVTGGPGFLNSLYAFLANIVLVVLQTVANLTALSTHVIVIVSQYNHFIDVPVVQTGWAIVRDITNMFFIIGLLIIAAGTILRIENYRYNRLLARLIIMAFLVNFSRLIAGFFIQTSQVVTLTFVNAYKDAMFGNFAQMFGLTDVLQFAAENSNGVVQGGETMAVILMSLLAGLTLMMVALIVTVSIAIIFLIRIIALWILVILSPLAFALRILPNTERYASRWWSDFGKYVTLGPVLAFILWLSLAIIVTTTGPTSGPGISGDTTIVQNVNKYVGETGVASAFKTELLSLEKFVSFLVGIIFLIMGLQYASAAGGAVGKFAGKAVGTATGAALGFSAVSALRNRTITPVQGWLANRRQRGQQAINERTAGLTSFADRVGGSTIGQVTRVGEAAKRGVGTGIRGGARLLARQPGTTVQGVLQDTAQAAQVGFQQGSTGFQRARQSIEGQRRDAIENIIARRDLRNADADTLNTMLESGNAFEKAAASTVGLQNGYINLNDERSRGLVMATIRSMQGNPEIRNRLDDALDKGMKRPATSTATLQELIKDETAPLSMQLNAGEELTNRRVLTAADANKIRKAAQQLGPDREESFLKSVYQKQGDVAIKAFHHDFSNAETFDQDVNEFISAVDRGAASQSILKDRHKNAMSGRAGQELSQRLTEMHQNKGTLDKMKEGMSDQFANDFYKDIDLDKITNIDTEDRRKIANATGHIHKAFTEGGKLMEEGLNDYLARNADKMAENISESAMQDKELMQHLATNKDVRAGHFVKMGEKSAKMRDIVAASLKDVYEGSGGLLEKSNGKPVFDKANKDAYGAQQKVRAARFLVTAGGQNDFDLSSEAGKQAMAEVIAAAEGKHLGRVDADTSAAYKANPEVMKELIGKNIRFDQVGELASKNLQLTKDSLKKLEGQLREQYENDPRTAMFFDEGSVRNPEEIARRGRELFE